MNLIVKIILLILLTPISGIIFAGLDRKFSAFLQSRIGPPILQPWYDFKKLMSKKNVVVNKYQNLYIFAYLAFVLLSIVMLFLQMDLLMILFVYTIANVALILGGMSTGSPYARIGSMRETVAMLAYEPVLVFYIVGMYMLTGSFNVSTIFASNRPLLVYLPLIFLAMLFIMPMKFKKSPFDLSASHHAHQELVKGMFTEYSGPTLAIIELAHWYEYTFLLGLMFLFAGGNIALGLILALITFILVIIIDNISARLTWEWTIKFTWTVVIGLCVANLLFLYLYKVKLF